MDNKKLKQRTKRTSSCPSSASQHCTAGEPLEMSCSNSSRLEAFGSASMKSFGLVPNHYALATNGNNKISIITLSHILVHQQQHIIGKWSDFNGFHSIWTWTLQKVQKKQDRNHEPE